MIVTEAPGIRVIEVRNVHEALWEGMFRLSTEGIRRGSRNGDVMIAPYPVVTVYRKPTERVLFWPDRDANPFFHLFEALWMLAGRNDVASVGSFTKQMKEYSDDGVTLHGAYGWRWRKHFESDQLAIIAARLYKDRNDRRSVLQMWDTNADLDRAGKDVPCNTMATFQRDSEGRLDLTIFCRSNDIIWGAYGANAVHFSALLEYMANWIGCPVGRLVQISVNWHAYTNTYDQCLPILDLTKLPTPYDSGNTIVVPMTEDHQQLDREIAQLLLSVESGHTIRPLDNASQWYRMVNAMLYAYFLFQNLPAPARYIDAIQVLNYDEFKFGVPDWLRAGAEWLRRRQLIWEAKLAK